MLKPGDVVTDIISESLLYGKQGLVVNVQLRFWQVPEVLVHFSRDVVPFHLSEYENPTGFWEIYDFRELRLEKDWSPEYYAKKFFGDRWHYVSQIAVPIDLDKPCNVKGCDNRQKQSIWINVWGSVYNLYVCPECASEFHRYGMDSWPQIFRDTKSA